MLTNELKDFIITYFNKRGLIRPNFDNAMKFAITEIGEVYEIDLASYDGWIRNNPNNKPSKFTKEDIAEELGDVIMMIMVAGIAEGVDPLSALIKKMCRKLGELKDE